MLIRRGWHTHLLETGELWKLELTLLAALACSCGVYSGMCAADDVCSLHGRPSTSAASCEEGHDVNAGATKTILQSQTTGTA